MKAIKIILAFVIFYFVITVISSVQNLVNRISLGNRFIELGCYVLLIVLTIVYLIIPLLMYLKKPSFKDIERMIENDKKAKKKIVKHLKKVLKGDYKEDLIKHLSMKDYDIKDWIIKYIKRQSESFDKIIMQHAWKLTATVLVSPNPFIDGITILYGNSIMIYKLSKLINFRYSWSQIWNMYFSVLSVASVTGLIEEFDDEIEEMIGELATEISELTGKSFGDSIPFINVFIKGIGPILQAASNFSFVFYNGIRFKYSVLNSLKETKESNETLMKNARKKARKEKYIYVKNMLEKSGVGVRKNIMGKADGIITKIKKTGKDTLNSIRKNLD